jgi:hypothetical protein
MCEVNPNLTSLRAFVMRPGEFFHYFIYIITKATTSEPSTTDSS